MDYPMWPNYDQDDIDSVVAVLSSGKVNAWTGETVSNFESQLATFSGQTHAIAMANGSVGLDLALAALGVGKGDEVIVSPRSFVASASCALRVGAVPVFADLDRDSQNLTAETIARKITNKTKAVVLVHLAGWPCDVNAIRKVLANSSIAIIEDCAQAHGAMIDGHKVGSLGDISSWSFCQDKIISTGGEGGSISTNDDELFSKLWSLKDHGKSLDKINDPEYMHAKVGYRWVHDFIGTNARMTGMQAAIGISQLKKLPQWHDKRTRNAQQLLQKCRNTPGLRIPSVPENVRHAYYLAYMFVEQGALKSGWDRDRIMSELQALHVPVSVGACPELYRENVFAKAPGAPVYPVLPVAQELGKTSLAFPVHPQMEDHHMDNIGRCINEVLAKAVC